MNNNENRAVYDNTLEGANNDSVTVIKAENEMLRSVIQTSVAKEVEQLRVENTQLKEENDILKDELGQTLEISEQVFKNMGVVCDLLLRVINMLLRVINIREDAVRKTLALLSEKLNQSKSSENIADLEAYKELINDTVTVLDTTGDIMKEAEKYIKDYYDVFKRLNGEETEISE